MNQIRTLFILFLSTAAALHAEFLYRAKDLGTLGCDKSDARSLNDSGWVVGKCFKQEQVVDFLWTPERGFEELTNEADREIVPKINNAGLVVGGKFKAGSWWSSDEMQMYKWCREDGFTLSRWAARGNGFSLIMNDKLKIYSDHVDVFKCAASVYMVKPPVEFPSLPRARFYPIAINNHSEMLVTKEAPGIVFSFHSLLIINVVSGDVTTVAEDRLYYGVGMNDDKLVIARNKEGTEGFYGTRELGMASLGNFIPVALNNAGDILGKKEDVMILRRADGTMITLSSAFDHAPLGIDCLVSAWAINNKGQILIQATQSGKAHAFLLDLL